MVCESRSLLLVWFLFASQAQANHAPDSPCLAGKGCDDPSFDDISLMQLKLLSDHTLAAKPTGPDCERSKKRYGAGDCVLQGSGDSSNCDGTFYNLDLYVKPEEYLFTPTESYTKMAKNCVTGNNLVWLSDKDSNTVETCQAKCDQNTKCVAIEFGVAYNGDGKGTKDTSACGGAGQQQCKREDPYKAGDCVLQGSADTTGCNGKKYNLDLYVQYVGKSPYTYNKQKCVKGNNLEWLDDKTYTPETCQAKCDQNPKCVAIEFGVDYGGAGTGTTATGDCEKPAPAPLPAQAPAQAPALAPPAVKVNVSVGR